MGSSKRNQRRRPNTRGPQHTNSDHLNTDDLPVHEVDVDVTYITGGDQQQAGVPACVRKLRSTEYGELEEACADISFFSLQPAHHAHLVSAGVPQRLVELLCLAPFSTFSHAAATQQAEGDVAADASSPSAGLHKGILCFQIAASEALRNLITNSANDEVVDALATVAIALSPSAAAAASAAAAGGGGGASPASTNFATGLLGILASTWLMAKEARRGCTPDDWVSEHQAQVQQEAEAAAAAEALNAGGNDDDTKQRQQPRIRVHTNTNSSMFFTLMRLTEELLQVVSVCAEGKETVAAVFSSPYAAKMLLDIMEVSTSATWDNVLHQANYFEESAAAAAAGSSSNDMAHHLCGGGGVDAASFLEIAKHYKRRETELLAAVNVAASDVLLVLSADNPTLSAALLSSTVAPTQQAFLNTIVDANQIHDWLTSTAAATASPLQEGNFGTLRRDAIMYQLLQATLSVQGTLLQASPQAENVSRVLPLVVAVLSNILPIDVWRQALPLLTESCELPEDVRALAVVAATRRLRCTQAAVKVLHAAVEFVCEHNCGGDDDEHAFAVNPLSQLLFQSNALVAFGRVLKNVLWLSEDAAAASRGSVDQRCGSGTASDDVMRRREQRALRGDASANAEVTTLQFLMLSTEVGVWGVAGTLLMMVPAQSLGDPSLIWRAMMTSVQVRYELISTAALVENQQQAASMMMGGGSAAAMNVSAEAMAAYTIATHSPAARQLLWHQLESLVQMLWTLQRKQSKALAASSNALAAAPSDVDLLTRLSWESKATPALMQASVGSVGLLCASFRTAEATTVGARYALAVLANAGGSGVPLAQLQDGVLQRPAPTNPVEREAYLAKLAIADGVVSVRCEAANTLIDLFIDETYDADVYVPLNVHAGLQQFYPHLRAYVKRRVVLARELKKAYRVSAEAEGVEQWSEVEENLGGFIEYKKQNVRR